ncbi:GntR family transcriptional regulator [Streptomyces massasporeus]|uniref:GntR family transcriptional regulator n=1 Tax=Streptomyces massasporeus TaxID=67324 RepID=UPI00365CE77B
MSEEREQGPEEEPGHEPEQERSDDQGGVAYQRVLSELHRRIADNTYAKNTRLPAQRALEEEFQVSRDTVQRALKTLKHEGWIESKRGSGTTVIKDRQLIPSEGGGVSLEDLMDKVFQRPEITLDVFTLTSESLAIQLTTQADRIRRGLSQRPERIALRMLLPAEDLKERAYPVAVNEGDREAVVERLLDTTHRNTAFIHDKLHDLRAEGLVSSVELKVRQVRFEATQKLYLFNRVEMLSAPYVPVKRKVHLRKDNRDVLTIDALGVGATLTHVVKDDRPDSQASVTVDSWQTWFDETWELLAFDPK